MSGTSPIDFGSACFTNGNNKWCDVYTFESCQVSIGWDTTVSGESGPDLDNSVLDAALQTAELGPSLCSPVFVDTPSVCSVQRLGANTCTTAFTFCVKRVGQDCRPYVYQSILLMPC